MDKHVFCRSSLGLALLAVLLFSPAAGLPRGNSQSFTSTKYASSDIAISPDGSVLVAVNPDSNSVTLVDTTTNLPLAEIPVGMDPRSVAISSNGLQAYVANQGSDTVSVVDLRTRTESVALAVGDRPVGVAGSPDGRWLAVAEMGADQVRLMDAQNLSTHSLHPVADRPYALAFTPKGDRLLVTHLLTGEVTILAIQPFRNYLPLMVNKIAALGPDVKTFTRFPTVQPPTGIRFVTGSMNASTSIPTWPQVAPAPGVIANSSGSRAYLSQTMANGLGYNTQFDTTVFPKISVLNLETNAHQTSEHISLPEAIQPVGLPWDMALARSDTELWVVNAASNDVSVVDISDPRLPDRVAGIPVGANPRGIVLSPNGATAYVNNTLAGTVSVIDTSAYTVTQVITVTTIPLPPALLNGKRLFHSSARPDLAQARWISCNTCHVEAEQDGRTWLLHYLGDVPPGEEPVIRRNTTSLLGMTETYPLRWSAEWDESADSEFSVRFEQFGTGLISGDMHPTLGLPNQGRSYDLDSLALFIDSLAVPRRIHSLTESERRGKEIFVSPAAQCLSCHPPPLYTDLKVHDVGTARGPGEWFGPHIDTPSLRFLYDSAPYLHDGSAPTLLAVLTAANPEDEHGVTSHLTGQQLADLIAFLQALPYEE